MAGKHGRRLNQTGRSEGENRHVRLEYWMLDHPAFLTLSANAKVALLYVAKRYDGFNNGRICFGWRSGCLVQITGKDFEDRSFGLSRHQTGRALAELESAGFIACTKEATFNQKRLTREWRLTWLPCNGKAPTREFASIKQPENLKPRCTGASAPPLQVHPCTYDMEPISPFDAYRCTSAPIANSHRCTSAPHLITMGCGGTGLEETPA